MSCLAPKELVNFTRVKSFTATGDLEARHQGLRHEFVRKEGITEFLAESGGFYVLRSIFKEVREILD